MFALNQTGTITRKVTSAVLAFCWVSGVISGAWFVADLDLHLISKIRDLTETFVSTRNLLIAALTPALISITVEFLNITCLLYPICFFTAFRLSFAFSVFYKAFTSAGWIIGFLVLFHYVLTIPMIYVYWLHCIRKERKNFSVYPALFLVSTVIFVLGLDIHYILPFVGSLISSNPVSYGF